MEEENVQPPRPSEAVPNEDELEAIRLFEEASAMLETLEETMPPDSPVISVGDITEEAPGFNYRTFPMEYSLLGTSPTTLAILGIDRDQRTITFNNSTSPLVVPVSNDSLSALVITQSVYVVVLSQDNFTMEIGVLIRLNSSFQINRFANRTLALTVTVPKKLLEGKLRENGVLSTTMAEFTRRKNNFTKAAQERAENLRTIDAKIEQLKEAVSTVFQENFWDFGEVLSGEFRPSGDSKYKLILHFPDITIKNSHNQGRNIKDLYVSLYFKDNLMLSSSTMYGSRFSTTPEEFVKRYRHSHLPTSVDYYIATSHFCTGSTEITALLGDMYCGAFKPEVLRTFLVMLLGYIVWESLEGGPYVRMETVGSQVLAPYSFNRGDSSNISLAANRVVALVDSPLTVDLLEVEEGKRGIKYKVNRAHPGFEQILVAMDRFTGVIDDTGRFFKLGSSNGSLPPPDRVLRDLKQEVARRGEEGYTIKFKGETPPVSVMSTESELLENRTITVCPIYKEEVALRLERVINQYILNIKHL